MKKIRFVPLYVLLLLSTSLTIAFILSGGLVLLSVCGILAVLLISCLIIIKWFRILQFSNALQGLNYFSVFLNPDHLSQQFETDQAKNQRRLDLVTEFLFAFTHKNEKEVLDKFEPNDPFFLLATKVSKEIEQLREDEEKRTWINNGLARFSEILRDKTELREFGQLIVSQLVKYTSCNQGGIYIQYQDNENNNYLKLEGCYAYDKRKHVENVIHEGEGLLGQCMLEKEVVYMTDIPKNYISITSGLGQATAQNIIILPLIVNETFCGAIELASFSLLMPHHVEFLKKVSANIAAEILALKNFNKTQSLLEKSYLLAEELKSREEEMRQNFEELNTTQEEMNRKQNELSGIIQAIDITLGTAELDESGNIIQVNSLMVSFFETTHSFFNNKSFKIFMGGSDITWSQIISGKVNSGDFECKTLKENTVWLNVTFTPIRDSHGAIKKILCLVQNITEKKLKEQEYESLSLVTNNTDNSVIITNSNGLIEYVNPGFTKMTGYTETEVLGKKPGNILQGPLTNISTISKLSALIKSGTPIYEEILNYTKQGQMYWVSLAINPIRNNSGTIIKYISIQSDITETKRQALDFQQKMDAISKSNAILEMDKAGVISSVNENYLKILGYSKEEIAGKNYSVLTNNSTDFDKIKNDIQNHGMATGIYERYNNNGECYQLQLMVYPVTNLENKIEKYIEFGVDVSHEQTLQKQANRKSAELKSYLVGINNTVASAEFSNDGFFLTGNEIFLKVLGYKTEDLAGKSWQTFMAEDSSSILMWDNLKLGKSFSGEFRIKSKSGQDKWLGGTFNPITIDSESPEKILMFAQFTSQEKEKIQELSYFVNTLKYSLPVLEFGPDNFSKMASDRAMKLFGLSRMTLKSKKFTDFLAPYFLPFWETEKDKLSTSELHTMVLPFQINNGIFHYEVSLCLIYQGERSNRLILVLLKEVTDSTKLLSNC